MFLFILYKMASELKIAILQSDLVWENPTQNCLNFQQQFEGISEAVDLIVLPEMFSTGFTMNAAKVAEAMDGKTVSWMLKMADKTQAAIVGSLVISDSGRFYNRLLFVHPSQKIDIYDKRHSFTLAKEHEVYTAGNQKLIVNYKNWNICPMICYDLRFPVWSRNIENYDLLLFLANWPRPRINAWTSLLQARAIENMSYTIGVNRLGKDGYGLVYNGHSSAYDYLGKLCAVFKENEGGIVVFTLEKKSQNQVREKLGFLNDRDTFQIQG